MPEDVPGRPDQAGRLHAEGAGVHAAVRGVPEVHVHASQEEVK